MTRPSSSSACSPSGRRRSSSEIKLPANPLGAAAAVVPLTVADLPERAEGWGVLDRLVWQDVDSNQLSSQQLDALRRWLAAGGRLVIVGGSAGIGTLSALPDDLLPYRPTATLDLDPASLVSLLGPAPDRRIRSCRRWPAPSRRGRALATSGDRAVAAELTYGSGHVTLLGFDPTTRWLAESKSVNALWRTALPPRYGGRRAAHRRQPADPGGLPAAGARAPADVGAADPHRAHTS